MGNLGRFAGALYVLTSIVGFFARGYVPAKLIVHGNTAATVNNIAAHEMLFRFGIAAQLISQTAFIFVAFALYKLLSGVDRRHASLMVILIVVSVPIAFVNEMNSLAALAFVRGADFLPIVEKPQRDTVMRSRLSGGNRFLLNHGKPEVNWKTTDGPLSDLRTFSITIARRSVTCR